MARTRYQKGSLFLQNKNNPVWVGRYIVDEIRGVETIRIRKAVRLGTKQEFPTRKLAQRALDRLLSPINSFEYRAQSTLNFAEVAEMWKTHMLPQLKPSTVDDYNSILTTHLLPSFGEMPVRDIRTDVVQRYITEACKVGGAVRVRKVVMTLKGILRMSQAWGYTDHELKALAFPRTIAKERPFFRIEDIRRLIATAPEPDATLYRLLAETGMRIGEALALQASDVVGAKVTIRRSITKGYVTEPKTRAGVRQIDISDSLATSLRALCAGASPWIFAENNADVLRIRLDAHTAALGIPKAGFHAFRHGNATIMDSEGVPMALRQQRLGHSNIATTLGTYTHQATGDSKALTEKLGSLFLDSNRPNVVEGKQVN